MNDRPQTFLQIILQMKIAMEEETALARAGVLHRLAAAAAAKQLAFMTFHAALSARSRTEPTSEEEQEALRQLIDAGNESALVLEAVKATLGTFLAKLRSSVAALTDPGIYNPAAGPRGRLRHVRPIRLDASA